MFPSLQMDYFTYTGHFVIKCKGFRTILGPNGGAYILGCFADIVTKKIKGVDTEVEISFRLHMFKFDSENLKFDLLWAKKYPI